jgi:pimeloyl-ACP methyl ester carboxylesterase/DNA-binding winged helix-turn-helix (wHTH) protein
LLESFLIFSLADVHKGYRQDAVPGFNVLFSFDDFSLDTNRRELRCGAKPIDVEPQVFDLIVFLIENRERVVSRDDLIAAIWNGRIVSESTFTSRINSARRALGDSGKSQHLIRTISRKGFRFVGEMRDNTELAPQPKGTRSDVPAQSIGFCRASDGVNIAFATAGSGPVLLKTANWLNHLEYDWQSPIWSPLFGRLAARFKLVRYDGRGNGLSDRDVEDISFVGFERDLDAVVAALKLERFVLLGLSQGAATAIAYAARHPERVSGLIVYGGYAQGRNRRASDDDIEHAQAVLGLMRQGWGQEDSAFMRAFASLYLPNGSREQIRWFAELQRLTKSSELSVRLRNACDDIDVADILSEVKVPTLVLHARRDCVVPVEQGRFLAANIPGARFVTIESENHVPIPGEPAWDELLRQIEDFSAGISVWPDKA